MAGLAKRDWPMWPMWLTRGLPERLRESGFPDFEDWLDRDGMRLEEYREDGTLVVKAEMPGIDPDKDVEITVANGVLSIHAERKEEHEEKDEEKGFYRSEFRYGQFTRRIALPAGASDKDVQANYNDGILEIRLPIAAEQARATKVPITRSP